MDLLVKSGGKTFSIIEKEFFLPRQRRGNTARRCKGGKRRNAVDQKKRGG